MMGWNFVQFSTSALMSSTDWSSAATPLVTAVSAAGTLAQTGPSVHAGYGPGAGAFTMANCSVPTWVSGPSHVGRFVSDAVASVRFLTAAAMSSTSLAIGFSPAHSR